MTKPHEQATPTKQKDQKELLQDILYDRRNDEPKEAYARWLEENGDKLQADYIREKVRQAVDERNKARVEKGKDYQEPYLCKEVTSTAEEMSGSRSASKEKFTKALLEVINSKEIGMDKRQLHIKPLDLLKGEAFVHYIYMSDEKIQTALDKIEMQAGTDEKRSGVNMAIALAMATDVKSETAYMPHSWVLDHLAASTFPDQRKFQIVDCIAQAAKQESYTQTKANELQAEAEKLGWDHLYKQAKEKMAIHKQRAEILTRRTGRDASAGDQETAR